MEAMTKDEIVNLRRGLNDSPREVVRAAAESLKKSESPNA